MSKILISYRRDDSEFPSHMIYQRLATAFDRTSVFIDVDTIPPGIDFRDYLTQAVSSCNVVLVVIGSHWLQATNAAGALRLFDPEDFVRIEIQTALQKNISVVPILLGGVKMPSESELPPELSELAYRNAVVIHPGRDFDRHMESLIERLERLLIDVAERASDAEVETISLNDRVFRELRLLGRGGMGEVWLAFDETLRRHVAIKRIRRDLLTNREAQRRFIQEARHCARLDHPNIVHILSIERDAGGPFLVLELMEGGSLRRAMNKRKLNLVEGLAFLRQMLLALKCAHDAGIVHRDIKPENIMLTKSGVPKLADFGLGWLMDGAHANEALASQSQAEGTAAYMAPELRGSGDSPTAQCDIYSLGMTFCEMITGAPKPYDRQRNVPSSVKPILQRMTMPNPNLRYHHVDEALHDVLELERAIELAGRTRNESRARMNRAVEQGFDKILQAAPVDAQACFERVLAEAPEHQGANAGLLLLSLMRGEMTDVAKRSEFLKQSDSRHPVFLEIQNYFARIPATTVLHATPHAMPFSYLTTSLGSGQLAKELVEYDNRTINLGDIGELLVELYQQRGGAAGSLLYNRSHDSEHTIGLPLPGLALSLSYRFNIARGGLLTPPRLRGICLTLAVTGSAVEVYRLIRYLANCLRARFRRQEWVDPDTAASFNIDPTQARQSWDLFACRFIDFARTAGRLS